MNKIILMGRLTRDPEIRYSNAAEPMAIVKYTLAVDRRIAREAKDSGKQSADFINCTAFGKSAEFAERYFRKGQMVCVSGRLQINESTDQSGQRRWFTDVLVEDQTFAESRASFESREGGGGAYQNNNNQQYSGGSGQYGASPQYGGGQQYGNNDQFVYSGNAGNSNNYNAPAQNNNAPSGHAPPPANDNSFFAVDQNLDDDDLPF